MQNTTRCNGFIIFRQKQSFNTLQVLLVALKLDKFLPSIKKLMEQAQEYLILWLKLSH